MEVEENRTGSADSENGSSDSYVHVPSEVQVQGGDPLCDSDQENVKEEELQALSEEREDKESFEKPSVMEGAIPTAEVLREDFNGMSSIEDVPEKHTEQPKPTIAQGLLSFLNVCHPAVLYVIYWKEPRLSAVVLGGILVTLLTLTLNTFIHTVVLFLLSFLVVSLTYIVIKIALDSFYNRPIKNPFSDYLSKNIALPEDKVVIWSKYIVKEVNCVFNVLARLMMFDNIKQTFKFGITLWLLSFVTNYLTLMRALFFGVMILFIIPPIYARHQVRIDQAVMVMRNTILVNLRRVLSRVPYLKDKMQ